jgi:hypothetical protein
MSTPIQIGFSQRVQLDWLEQTAALVLAGQTREQIEATLQERLRDKLSIGGTAQRGNREKAITILLKTWVSVPTWLQPFRDDGLGILRRLPPADRIAVHWGMTMAAYPFFGAVAETVGRLMRLQGTCVAAQIQRRLREQLGERDTVARAARRILRCFVDWDVLQETREKGFIKQAQHGLCQTSSSQCGSLKPRSWLRVLIHACCKHSCRLPPCSPFVFHGFMLLT